MFLKISWTMTMDTHGLGIAKELNLTKKLCKIKKTMLSSKAKFESQQKMLDTIDKAFSQNLIKRDRLITKSDFENQAKIVSTDLLLSELIKKRARLTEGGYNYIPLSMWDWNPHFPINKNLLPKTIR